GGMLPQLLDSNSLELVEVPVQVIEGELFFFLSAASNIAIRDGNASYQTHHYTDTLHYLIQTQQRPGSTIPQLDLPIVPPATQGVLYRAQSYKNELYNLLSSGRNWYGERVFDNESITLNFSEKASSGLPLFYQGKFMAQSFSESKFSIRINQILDENFSIPPVTNSRYAIKGREILQTGFTKPALEEEEVQVRFQFQTPDRNGTGYLDYLIIGFPFYADNLPLGVFYNFSADSYQLKPSNLQRVWDVSNFHDVKEITSTESIRSNAQKIAVFLPESAQIPNNWEKVELKLRTEPGFTDLLIISPRE